MYNIGPITKFYHITTNNILIMRISIGSSIGSDSDSDTDTDTDSRGEVSGD
jgi:hypothetical protein